MFETTKKNLGMFLSLAFEFFDPIRDLKISAEQRYNLLRNPIWTLLAWGEKRGELDVIARFSDYSNPNAVR